MLEIRKSYPTDAYHLVEIRDMVWKNEYYDILPNGIIYDMLKNVEESVRHLQDQIQENNRILVAVYDEQIVGFIFYAKAQNSVYASSAEIRELFVLPDYQKKGIGKALFDKAFVNLQKLGFHSLIVHCPSQSRSVSFFAHLGGLKKETVSRKILDYSVLCDIIYFDLEEKNDTQNLSNEWNDLYARAQEHLFLLNPIHKEIAVILTNKKNLYMGIGIKNQVCPIESALANMYLAGEKVVEKILILNRESKPVLPCGKCRDLLLSLKQNKAIILFDIGDYRTMTMEELNPYYKDEEK